MAIIYTHDTLKCIFTARPFPSMAAGVAPLFRGQPCASSRLAYMDVGKGREQGGGSFALNENEHTLNTHFQISWV